MHINVDLADLVCSDDQIQAAVYACLKCDHFTTSCGGEIIIIVLSVTRIVSVVIHFEDSCDLVCGRSTFCIGHHNLVPGCYFEHDRKDAGVMSDEMGVLSICT